MSAPQTAAVEFLQWLRPGGPWMLTAIIPDGETETITARDAKAVDDFVHANDGKRNLYYSVNPTRTEMRSKAAKVDIAAVEYVLADLDPKATESPEAAKARYLEALETYEPAPAAIVDSGNGIQGLFRLGERIDIGQYLPVKNEKGELVLAPKAAAVVDDVEARCKELMERLGGDAGTQNIDRILRLPGTTNLPTKSKREKGRVACPAKLMRANGATCGLSDFPKPEAVKEKTDDAEIKLDWDKVATHAGWLKTVADLPDDFNAKGRMIIANDGNIKELSLDLQEAGRLEKPYGKWSAVSMALAAVFKADGRFAPEQIAAALLCPLKCNSHIAKLVGDAKKRRAVERLLNRSHEPAVKRDDDFAYEKGVVIRNSQANIRVALGKLGAKLRHDVFQDRLLIDGVADVGPLLDDRAISRVWLAIDERYGFRPDKEFFITVITDAARRNSFHPVLDYLDALSWDGVPRIDNWLVRYAGADDTPYVRAVGRLMLVAATPAHAPSWQQI